MIPLQFRFVRLQQRLRGRAALVPAALCAAWLCSGVSAYAIGVPKNLGNGLDKLVESNLALKAEAKQKGVNSVVGPYSGYATEAAANASLLAVRDKQGRVQVRVYFNGEKSYADSLTAAKASSPTLNVTSQDSKYHAGVIEGFVAVADIPMLATAAGVSSVIMDTPPIHRRLRAPAVQQAATPGATVGQTYPNLGTYFDQGVIQHRVDQVSKFYNANSTLDLQGQGLSIACISNSFAANTANPASLDVTNGDLPGGTNAAGNTTPVFVLMDDLASATSDDEGRGMCQIVYHMAPKAMVGFATADAGELGFANAIRGLAGINSTDFPNASTQGFAADVICDDVGYFDEPFYQDGIIGAGIEDVAATGVSYFSSAANDIGINGYESVIRLVPPGTGLTAAAGNTSLANTNINLANVPPALYAGGFHNFNPTPGQLDVAQTVNVAANNTVPTILQWNDPYDQNTAATGATTLFTGGGTYAATDLTFTVTTPVTQGTLYQVVEAASGSTFDGIVTVYKSDGTTVIAGPQDTGTDETVRFAAPANDTGFVIKIGHFSTTTGAFTLTVSSFTGFSTPGISSDWNLLAFNATTGAYIPASSLTTNNLTTNQPIELGYVNRTGTGQTSVQYVFARSNTPTGRAADHIRYVIPGNGRAGYGPREYFSYNTVTTSGHATSPSCNGTAAYAAFRPNVPENFSSPGPATIYFDKNSNLLPTPQVRLQPGVAAMDAGNISANEGLAGLGSDSTSDYDAAANFSGTSAAAPHAAACALLVLQAHGGKRSVTPAQMTTILHQTAFPHDLDPNMATSNTRATNGGKVSLTFASDNESNTGTGLNDPNSLAVSYVGPSYITSLVFNPQADAAHAGDPTSGNNGLDATGAYFSNVIPGLVFPAATTTFAVGSGSVGLAAADVTAATSNLAGAPSTTQNWTLTLSFPNANFTGGKILHFTISRQVHSSSVVPTGTSTAQYSADLFGGGVLLPEGTVTTPGMYYQGTLGDGSTFSGYLKNNIGAGYSKLDGFGFINVPAAAAQPLP